MPEWSVSVLENDRGMHGFSPRLIASRGNSTFNTSGQADISTGFLYAAAVLQTGGHICWEWPAKSAGWNTVELRDFRSQKQHRGRELYLTACDSWCFAKRENNLWANRVQQFLTSDVRIKE